MWLTSKIPTPLRTALCSATRPPLEGYSTGISHPPKLTIFAPSFLCSAFSGVLRSSVLAEEFTESIPLARAEIHSSTRSKVRQRIGRARPRYNLRIMPVVISLLRAVNVGGTSIIKMPDLRALFESLKFKDVQTYIQSGNVVFRTE